MEELGEAEEDLVERVVDGVGDEEDEAERAVQRGGLDQDGCEREVVPCVGRRKALHNGGAVLHQADDDKHREHDVNRERDGVVCRLNAACVSA